MNTTLVLVVSQVIQTNQEGTAVYRETPSEVTRARAIVVLGERREEGKEVLWIAVSYRSGLRGCMRQVDGQDA